MMAWMKYTMDKNPGLQEIFQHLLSKVSAAPSFSPLAEQ